MKNYFGFKAGQCYCLNFEKGTGKGFLTMKQKMFFRIIGAALMIAGVTLGIGILGLPVQTGLAGIVPSMILMLVVWLFMLATGWIIARHVTHSDNPHEDFGTLFSRSLGLPGKILTYIGYLLLLYGILVAHLAAGGQILKSLGLMDVPLQLWVLLFFAVSTAMGILGGKQIEKASSALLLMLLVVFFALTYFAIRNIVPSRLTHVDWRFSISAVPIIVCALAYHIIIPTVCRVLDNDFRAVKKALVIGTIIPLFINGLWIFAVLGALPLTGDKTSIMAAFKANEPAVIPLALAYPGSTIRGISLVFSLVVLVLSYVLQATAMISFFNDILSKQLPENRKIFSRLMTFIPALTIVLIWPNLFLTALNLTGGVSIVLLCGILPALIGIQWARKQSRRHYILMVALLIFFCAFLALELAQECGFLKIDPEVEYGPVKIPE